MVPFACWQKQSRLVKHRDVALNTSAVGGFGIRREKGSSIDFHFACHTTRIRETAARCSLAAAWLAPLRQAEKDRQRYCRRHLGLIATTLPTPPFPL